MPHLYVSVAEWEKVKIFFEKKEKKKNFPLPPPFKTIHHRGILGAEIEGVFFLLRLVFLLVQ